MRAHLTLLVAVAAVTAAACGQDVGTTAGGDATEPTTAGATATAEATTAADATEASAAAATVAVASSDLGEILVDGEGRALYLFTNDEQGGASTCTDGCAANWPPLEGPATAGDGADESLLDVVERDDGAQQVTYRMAAVLLRRRRAAWRRQRAGGRRRVVRGGPRRRGGHRESRGKGRGRRLLIPAMRRPTRRVTCGRCTTRTPRRSTPSRCGRPVIARRPRRSCRTPAILRPTT